MGALTYLKLQIEEIRKDTALVWLGVFLCLTHVLTFTYWNTSFFLQIFTNENSASLICWPFFPDCDQVSLGSLKNAQIVLLMYLSIAILGAVLFALRRISLGYIALLTLAMAKQILILKSYSFMGNFHYMALWTTLAFLLFPGKVSLLFYLTISYYLSASSLKFNYEWLSGAALVNSQTFFSGILLNLSLIYVVLLQFCFVWGLAIKNKWLFWLTLFQFTLFHAYSWHLVGYFYPSIMVCLLSFFVFKGLQKDHWQGSYLFQELPRAKSAIIFLSLFWIFQLVPQFAPTASHLGGIWRLTALNMLDARTECTVRLYEQITPTQHVESDYFQKTRGLRAKCDPIVYLSQVHKICRETPERRLELVIHSKVWTDKEFQPSLRVRNICQKPYNLLWAELFEVLP